MGEGYFLDIIFFAMVAAFIFLRLRSVLGRRTGQEEQRREAYRVRQQQREEKVVSLPDRIGREREGGDSAAEAKAWAKGTPAEAGLTQIKIADPRFEPSEFLDGARAAYDMTVNAFAEGDRETLRSLLSDDVYENFLTAIEAREAANQTQATTITTIKAADIVDASLDGKVANVTVKFVSDMISVTKDESDAIVAGDPHEHEVVDVWTFARDTASRAPDWALVETRSES